LTDWALIEARAANALARAAMPNLCHETAAHPAANTKVSGDLEVNVVRAISDSVGTRAIHPPRRRFAAEQQVAALKHRGPGRVHSSSDPKPLMALWHLKTINNRASPLSLVVPVGQDKIEPKHYRCSHDADGNSHRLHRDARSPTRVLWTDLMGP
jgi:hypothetical protein